MSEKGRNVNLHVNLCLCYQVWDMGLTGRGVVVTIMDDGKFNNVAYFHPIPIF